MEQWSRDKLKREEQLRSVEIARVEQDKKDEARRKEEKERLESPVYKAKLFGEALRGTVAKMSSDALDLIPWLRNVEKLFVDFAVSDNLKLRLFIGADLSKILGGSRVFNFWTLITGIGYGVPGFGTVPLLRDRFFKPTICSIRYGHTVPTSCPGNIFVIEAI
jgi:hypothetical protein